jgi:hypothetical protein
MDAIFDLTMCSMIFHNMIIEYEQDQNWEPLFDRENVTHLKKGLTFQADLECTQELQNT